MAFNLRANRLLNRRTYRKIGEPSKIEGRNGDHMLAHMPKGMTLCYKIDGEWKELGTFRDVNRMKNKLSLDELTLKSTAQIGSDTDKILMLDNGVVKYVTGANLATYIGVPTNHITNNAADIMAVSDFGANAALKIDADQPATAGAEDSVGLWIDYDRIVAGSGTAAHNDIGINLDVNSASLGTSTVKGMDIDVVGATSGTHTATGIDIDVSGADNNTGLYIKTAGTHIAFEHPTDSDDYANIALADGGNLTITTHGDGVGDGNIILDAEGDIEINADGQQIHFKDGSALRGSVVSSGIGVVAAGKLILDVDSVAHTYLQESSDDVLDVYVGGVNMMKFTENAISATEKIEFINSDIHILNATDNADKFVIAVGASGETSLRTIDDGAAIGHLVLDADGTVIFKQNGNTLGHYINPIVASMIFGG